MGGRGELTGWMIRDISKSKNQMLSVVLLLRGGGFARLKEVNFSVWALYIYSFIFLPLFHAAGILILLYTHTYFKQWRKHDLSLTPSHTHTRKKKGCEVENNYIEFLLLNPYINYHSNYFYLNKRTHYFENISDLLPEN